MSSQNSLSCSIETHGFAVVGRLVPRAEVVAVVAALSGHSNERLPGRGRGVHAIRNLLEVVPEVQSLAQAEPIRKIVEAVLGADAFVVRGLLFDKTPTANWKVAWHQDLTIAVGEKLDAPGFGPWSEKAGIPHVQPPVSLLERMLTVRVQLDDCGRENGPLKVIAGSHRSGRLSPADIARWREASPATTCTSARGGAVIMRPLVLHASSAATAPRHRRVVHLEFAAEELPHGLQWHGRWRP